MDGPAIREAAITVSVFSGAVTGVVAAVTAVVYGLPRLLRSWERRILARAERDEAVTHAVKLIPDLSERLKRLEHEVVPNGDPLDDRRPLRDHVRTQGQVQHSLTGAVEEIRQRMAVGDQHFQSHDVRLESLERWRDGHEHPPEGGE